jgi:pSer/pThr/pTyr-binding forkhead associated (FHA) protein
VRSGPVHGRRFYLTEETTTIGKDANNAIVLKDGTVSKRHAGVRIKDGKRYEVHDFGSSNGTFVNERRVSKQFLKDGDVIKLGETEMIFTLE